MALPPITFIFSASSFLAFILLIWQCQSTSDTPPIAATFGRPSINATYDYVVVGGGTVGVTIATRLAENPIISVAVIEAGGFYEVENGNRSAVPGYAGFGVGTALNYTPPAVDWPSVEVPQAVGRARC